MTKILLPNWLKKADLSYNTVPIAFFVTCVIGFGLLIPWLGFYLDDWYIVWFEKFFGAGKFIDFFGGDRPFLSAIYMIFTPIFNDSPVAWQIFGLFTKWILVLVYWLTLKMIWPNNIREVTWVAFLFLVFPGFSFHWFSVQFSQIYLLMAMYFASYLGMLWTVRRSPKNWLGTVVSLVCMAYPLFAVEYFYGLELLRPFVLWKVLGEVTNSKSKRFTRTIKGWLPYLFIFIVYSVWRIFFWQSFMYEINIIDSIHANPKTMILRLIVGNAQSFVDAAITVWARLFNLSALPGQGIYAFVIWFLVIGSVLGYLIYFLSLREDPQPKRSLDDSDMWGKQAIVAGSLAILFSLIPFNAASIKIDLEFPSNRFMLVFALGSSLFLVGALAYLVKTKQRRVIFLSILLGLSIGTQLYTANTYQRLWKAQREFFWQLYWRVPGLKPGTLLITDDLPFSKFYSDTSLTAPLNWIYAPDLQSPVIPYQLVMTDSPLVNNLSSFQPNQPVNIENRAYAFSGNTSQSVFLVYPPGGCLRLLDSNDYMYKSELKNHSREFVDSISLSNFNNIMLDATPLLPPPHILFGREDKNNWCYYFEKADLARQKAEWNSVANLWMEANSLGLSPKNANEYYPFIEAFTHLGDFIMVEQLAKSVIDIDLDYESGLCGLLRKSEGFINDSDVPRFIKINEDLNCVSESKP